MDAYQGGKEKQRMYVKLEERCKIFSIHGIHMVGCPITNVVFGLTEAGYKFVTELKEGIQVDIDDLSEEIKELYVEMDKSGFFTKNIKEQKSKSAYLHVTNRCNMKCNGCYSKSNIACSLSELDLEKMYQIIDNMVDAGFYKIVISGGEPFLRQDIVEIIRYMKKKDCEVFCITNGIMEDEKYREALQYLDGLSFSMDGISEETSVLRKKSFKKIESLLEQLEEYKEKLSIIFTLHNRNMHIYNEMKEYAKKKAVSHNFSLFSARRNKSTEEFLIPVEKLIDLFQRIDEEEPIGVFEEDDIPISCKTCCGAGRTRISISADGKIYPCHMMHENQFILGDALIDNIKEIIKNTPEEGYVSVNKRQECSSCEYAYLCGGGCLYRAYMERGKIEDKDQLCAIYKKRIDDALSPFFVK